MNIGLIDVDGHGFPNLALMKISRYYKNQGCNVEWYNIFQHYDIVYLSKVFTFTPDYQYYIATDLFNQKINNLKKNNYEKQSLHED